jgi:hypothetical protein
MPTASRPLLRAQFQVQNVKFTHTEPGQHQTRLRGADIPRPCAPYRLALALEAFTVSTSVPESGGRRKCAACVAASQRKATIPPCMHPNAIHRSRVRPLRPVDASEQARLPARWPARRSDRPRPAQVYSTLSASGFIDVGGDTEMRMATLAGLTVAVTNLSEDSECSLFDPLCVVVRVTHDSAALRQFALGQVKGTPAPLPLPKTVDVSIQCVPPGAPTPTAAEHKVGVRDRAAAPFRVRVRQRTDVNRTVRRAALSSARGRLRSRRWCTFCAPPLPTTRASTDPRSVWPSWPLSRPRPAPRRFARP